MGQHRLAAGDTAEEIDDLRRGGGGHIVVWGGVTLWRSLMRLDLIDDLRLSLFPYAAGEGTGCSRASRSPTDSPWSPAPLEQRDRLAAVPPSSLAHRPGPQGTIVMAT